MIKISLKGLAKFMTSSAAGQRKILRDYKYPDPEGFAQALYYREARDLVCAFHQSSNSPDWLSAQASSLQILASRLTGQSARRVANNARAVRAYHTHFSDKVLTVKPDITLEFLCGNIRVTVCPDLYALERNREKLFKLEFGTQGLNPDAAKIISQIMFEATVQKGMGLSSSDVCCVDVPRGLVYKGARVGSRMIKEVEAACQNITSIWQNL